MVFQRRLILQKAVLNRSWFAEQAPQGQRYKSRRLVYKFVSVDRMGIGKLRTSNLKVTRAGHVTSSSSPSVAQQRSLSSAQSVHVFVFIACVRELRQTLHATALSNQRALQLCTQDGWLQVQSSPSSVRTALISRNSGCALTRTGWSLASHDAALPLASVARIHHFDALK